MDFGGCIESRKGIFQLYVISLEKYLYIGVTEDLAPNRWAAHFSPTGSFVSALRSRGVDEPMEDFRIRFFLYDLDRLLKRLRKEGQRRALQHIEHEAHLVFGRRRALGVARRIVSDTLRTAPKDSLLSKSDLVTITTDLADDLERRLCE